METKTKTKKNTVIALMNIPVIAAFTVFVVFTTFALTGCHSNPLLTAKKDQAVKFLVAAQNEASQKTHLYDSGQSVYVTCVQNPSHYDNPLDQTAKNPCDGYLQTMVSYASQTKDFKGLTLGDLKNQTVIKNLGQSVLDEMIKQGF